MKRRKFLARLGAAAERPVLACAQQTAMPVVGFLANATSDGCAPYVAAEVPSEVLAPADEVIE